MRGLNKDLVFKERTGASAASLVADSCGCSTYGCGCSCSSSKSMEAAVSVSNVYCDTTSED